MHLELCGTITRACLLALLSGCAPAFVDSTSPVTSPAAGSSSSVSMDLPQGSVIPTTPKPSEVVNPPPVPNVGADLAPDVPVTVSPVPNRVPPRPPLWQSPPPNYNASRPDAAPLGLPGRPPAAWRY